MKLSDYVAQRIENLGITTVFGYQGSSISHIIDSVSKSSKIDFIETRHEQAAAFAANGYATVSGTAGVALSCSGPGATNLITGIANAYFDSIPCLFIVGQVSTHELKKDRMLRQSGFQEVDTVSLVSPITKYAISVRNPNDIAIHLDKAITKMLEGRQGPSLIELPHDIQKAEIEPSSLNRYSSRRPSVPELNGVVQSCASLLENASRPLILLGGGSKKLKRRPDLLNSLYGLGIPIVTSYRGKDIIDNNMPCNCGVIGAYGNRHANWAAKYCNSLLVIGSRLDGRQTVDGITSFANKANIIMVDIDTAELNNCPDDYCKINQDAVRFTEQFLHIYTIQKKHLEWLSTVCKWKSRYPTKAEYTISERVNPNLFLEKISRFLSKDAVIAIDVGQNQIWANASLNISRGQTLIQSCGLGSMGFALPAAIGGYYAKRTETVCFCGDGGFQMNSQELQTALHNRVPLKIFILNNESLGLIRNYQSKALDNRLFGSVIGFDSPNYKMLAQAYGFKYFLIEENNEIDIAKDALSENQPCIIEVLISRNSTNYPEPTYMSTVDNQSAELSLKELETIKGEANECH